MSSASAASGSPPAPTAASSRRGVWLGVTAAIAVALVLAVLFSTGTLAPSHGATGSSPGGGAYPSFQQAEGRAQSAVAGAAGGPWSPLLAVGVAAPSAAVVPALNLTGLPSLSECTVSWSAGAPPNVTVPETGRSASAGTSAFWLVGFVNGSDNLRLTIVADGNASLLAVISGSHCTEILAYANPLSSAIVVDSPRVAENVSAAGGAAWVAAHTNVTETWEIVPGATLGPFVSPPTWHAYYTTCSLSTGGPKEGDELTANLTAATGYVSAYSTGSGSCASSLGALGGASGPDPPLSARQTI